MQRFLPVLVAALAIAVATAFQGVWSERWGTYPELEVYAKEVSKLPVAFGAWKSKPGAPVSQREGEIAGLVASASRNYYTNPQGQTVNVFLACGRVNDIYYHTPDRCYPAAGFETGANEQDVTITAGGADSVFKTTTFRKETDHGTERRQIFWSFSGGGKWEVQSNRWWSLQGHRALYKVYVEVQSFDDSKLNDNALAQQFLQEFMPELQKAIKPGSSSAAQAASAPKKP